jgi:orotidine-5'-phosphate decarboxylase
VQAGSSMLVVGRPIRDAIEPNLAAQAIRAEMLGAVSEQLG